MSSSPQPSATFETLTPPEMESQRCPLTLKSSGFSERCSFLLMALKLFLHEDRLLLAKELNHSEEMGGEVAVGWEMVTQATVIWGGGVKNCGAELQAWSRGALCFC